MIRILLADDHQLVRAGLARLLDTVEDMEVVGAAGNGAEAVELANKLEPDIILMDLSMPGMDGIEATRILTTADNSIKIVALTAHGDQTRIMSAVDAGAIGYLLKDTEPEDLLRGIRAAARGEAPLDPRAARVVLGAHRARSENERNLSNREREVLACLAEGQSNKQIARQLAISEKTVKGHLTKVFQTIGVTDRTGAALWAKEQGLAELEGI